MVLEPWFQWVLPLPQRSIPRAGFDLVQPLAEAWTKISIQAPDSLRMYSSYSEG